jgi:hypothetical protein
MIHSFTSQHGTKRGQSAVVSWEIQHTAFTVLFGCCDAFVVSLLPAPATNNQANPHKHNHVQPRPPETGTMEARRKARDPQGKSVREVDSMEERRNNNSQSVVWL